MNNQKPVAAWAMLDENGAVDTDTWGGLELYGTLDGALDIWIRPDDWDDARRNVREGKDERIQNGVWIPTPNACPQNRHANAKPDSPCHDCLLHQPAEIHGEQKALCPYQTIVNHIGDANEMVEGEASDE